MNFVTIEIDQEACRGEESEMETLTNSLAEQTADPSVRMERIKAIQSAIADGTYHVSASDVAAKVISRLQK